MKEEEIRPQALFNRYLGIVRADMARYFGDPSEFVTVPCPACESPRATPAFVKLGFPFVTCDACGSLYASPRPTSAALDRYYTESESVRFWSSEFYRQTQEARREKIFRPRAHLVAELAKGGELPGTDTFADIGSGFGIFLEEVARVGVFREIVGIEPAPNMAVECRKRGFRTVESSLEAVPAGTLRADLAASFEVLEHVFDPATFLRGAHGILREGGVVLLTTLTVSGFDLQVLWNESKSIHPPHINLLSVEGMRLLAERSGFEVVAITTPGQLDVDIVKNALAERPDLQVPRFVRHLIERRGPEVHREFQRFLQDHHLSSHVRLILRKTEARS